MRVVANVAVSEHRIAGHKQISARADHVRNGGEIDASVNLNAKSKSAPLANLDQHFNFSEGAGNKFLRAKPRIYGHDENVMHDFQDFIEQVHWGRGIDHHGRLATVGGNQVQRSIQMRASLLVHGDPIGPCIGKSRDVIVRILDHQMTVKRDVRDHLTQRGNDRRTNSQVRNEMSIHYIEMQDRAATLDGG